MTYTIKQEPPSKCSECSETKELRPYGKNGAFVCFECAMKDEETAIKRFNTIIDAAKKEGGNA